MKNIIEQMNEGLENKYFLKEAAQDKQNFINFAGKDLADRFEKLKDANRVKNDTESGRNYADYYYWIHQPIDRLIDYVNTLENTVSGTKARKKSESEIKKEGAKLIADSDGWRVYKITTPEAAQLYGRNTRWCLSDNDIKRSTYNFNNYKLGGVNDYYFLIPNNDPKGKWCYLDYGEEAYHDAGAAVFRDSEDNIYTINDVLRRQEIPMSIIHSLPGLKHCGYTEEWLDESFLIEGKEDEEKFIAFAGEDLARRFNELKRNNRIKNVDGINYADYGYWETLPFGRDELEKYVAHLEANPSNSQLRRSSKQGAECLYNDNGWKIYRIDTYDASKYYGENTKWCITGRYGGAEDEGQKYFDSYKNEGVKNYYFLIPDNNPHGKWCYLEWDTEDQQKSKSIFFNAADSPYMWADMPKISRRIPSVVLNQLPYLQEYVPYKDKGNIELVYRESGDGCTWNLYRTVTQDGYYHYLNRFGEPTEGSPLGCYIVMRNRAPRLCYYYYGSIAEANKYPVFRLIPQDTHLIGGLRGLQNLKELPELTGIPATVLQHLPYVDEVLGQADAVMSSIHNGRFVYDESYGTASIRACSDKISEVFVPNTVRMIKDGSFFNIKTLSSVVFEDGSSLVEIGANAFGLTNTESIKFPPTLTTIGNGAFYGCTNLHTLLFDPESSLQQIGAWAFYECRGLKDVVLPASVSRIETEAFYACTRMTSLSFEPGSQLQQIGSLAFMNCYLLRQITIPRGVTSIQDFTFSGDTELSEVIFESGSTLKTIYGSAFNSTHSMKELRLPASVTQIDLFAFDWSGIERLVLEGPYYPQIFTCETRVLSCHNDFTIDWVNAGKQETVSELIKDMQWDTRIDRP